MKTFTEMTGNGDLFTVVWEQHSHHCKFKVYELLGDVINDDGTTYREYALKEWHSLPKDATTLLEEAEEYMSGSIKWDGCSEIEFSNHLCGSYFFKQHIKLLEYLYKRAMELMDKDEDPWGD